MRSDCRDDRLTSRVEQVLDQQRRDHLEPEPPAPPAVGQQRAARAVSQGTNGSQIRSTSALLIPDRSAIATTTTGRADEQQRPRRAARCRRVATASPAPSSGPALTTQAGAGCPTTSTTAGRSCGDPVVVALPQHRVGVPPREAGRREDEHDRQRRDGRDRQRPPRAGRPPGPRARAAPAAAGRRTSSRRSRAAARQRGTAHQQPAAVAEGQAGQPPGHDRREHGVGRHRHEHRGGLSTRNGAARRASSSASSARSVTSTAAAVDAASTRDHQPGGQVAAEPDAGPGRRRTAAPGRVAGDVGGPVVLGGVGDPVDVGRRAARGTSSTLARGPQVLVRVAQRPATARGRRRQRERQQPGQRPRRTTPAAAGARAAGRPGRRRTASPRRATATAGSVPGPNSFGRHSPCRGGTSCGEALRGARAATSQSSQCGSPNATTSRTTAVTQPSADATAARDRAPWRMAPTLGRADLPRPARRTASPTS